MEEERVGRRSILGAGTALLASLAGCGGLFIDPEPTDTPGGRTPTPEPTPTPTPAPTVEPTTTPTATPEPLPSDLIDVRSRRLSIQRSQLETFALVDYRFDVENTGRRVIDAIEFRVSLRYEHEDISRSVGSAYPRFRFDTDDEDDGLRRGETETVRGNLRFERDGRAQESTDTDRFSIELTVRRIVSR
ncbi:hypothetical protein [Haloplanus halobius]|uniref:hypothetical protein n=1 Tax=Haloplanus halobius TaxID=2934938 RepID=UPI00200E4050|nr:hypothetical protein [Haloplanus sp. XH21]